MIFANTANPLRTSSYRKQVGKVWYCSCKDNDDYRMDSQWVSRSFTWDRMYLTPLARARTRTAAVFQHLVSYLPRQHFRARAAFLFFADSERD